MTPVDPEAVKEGMQAAEDAARNELGPVYKLVEMGDAATVDSLLDDLGVQDRLDAMIDRCLKRLLFLKGLKSVSPASSSALPKRLAGQEQAG